MPLVFGPAGLCELGLGVRYARGWQIGSGFLLPHRHGVRPRPDVRNQMGQSHERADRGSESPRSCTTPREVSVFAGRYEVQRILRECPTAQTLLAQDLHFDRQVVIKSMSCGHLSAGVRMRLQHEATALRGAESSCLCIPLTIGCEGDLFYVVSPYIDGISLRSRLARQPLTLPESLAVGSSLAEASRSRTDAACCTATYNPRT